MYNKLFTKILDSSIWLESMPTRIVWLAIIAAMDEHGYAQFASVANVAHRARVSLDEAEAAIRCLESPDANSSDPDNDGRRIERVPGGWLVLNSEKHRVMVTKAVIQEQTRERVRRHRDRQRAASNAPVTVPNEKLTPSEAVSVSEARSESGALAPCAPAAQPAPRLPAPLIVSPLQFDRKHGGHVIGFCDWVCLPSDLVEQFAGRASQSVDEVIAWARTVRGSWLALGRVPSGRMYDFWNDRWTEAHPAAKPGAEDPAARKARLIAAADARMAQDAARRAAR